MKKSIVTLKTITQAQKGKKALSRNGIKSNLVKIDQNHSLSGCQYGLEFDDILFYSVISILRENEIDYGVYKRQ